MLAPSSAESNSRCAAPFLELADLPADALVPLLDLEDADFDGEAALALSSDSEDCAEPLSS